MEGTLYPYSIFIILHYYDIFYPIILFYGKSSPRDSAISFYAFLNKITANILRSFGNLKKLRILSKPLVD